MTRHDSHENGTDTKLSRRSFVAATGSALAAGLAGCSEVTEQSFGAQPVVLPDGAREELVLAETARDSATIRRSGPADSEVEITNEATVYRRGPARGTPTVLEQFTGGVNQTPGSGSNINARASDLGIDEARLPFFEGDPSVPGDQFSLVVPEGARHGGELQHGKLMALVPGTALSSQPGDSERYDGDGPGAFLSLDVFLPDVAFFPEGGAEFMDWSPDVNQRPSEVFVPNVDDLLVQTPKVGIEELPEGAERVDPGITIEPAETVFAGRLADFGNPHDLPPYEDVVDQGVMLPLGGQPYGLAALATPDASVAGQSANPLVGMDTAELLQRDAARRVLARTGITDADSVEWLAGPEETAAGGASTEIFDDDAELRTFVGVVSGEDGPWGVAVTVARVTPDDHVVAAGVIRRPVGTVDGGMAAVEGSGWGMTPGAEGSTLAHFQEFSAETMASLEQI